MSKQVKFDGVPHNLGGTLYIVPGLSTKQMRQLRDRIVRAIELEQQQAQAAKEGSVAVADASATMFEILDIAVDVTHAALTRNYEGIDKERLEEWVDMNNSRSLMMAVMGQSGFQLVREVPEVAESGEA